ncbi:ABC transporter substrate-binding protein [Humibacillus xanthopallidus]|uniref:ABC transporter substrate-binding protein n=1 Tax=Humibacillus xanthopallidus TaxID=412689 RepID=UPI00385061B8
MLSRWPRAARRLGVGVVSAVVAAVVATGAASCTTSPSPTDGGGAGNAAVGVAAAQGGQPGGTLRVLVAGSIDTWDPQLMYVGPEAFFAQRTFARGLTAYGIGERQRDLQGDLATDTGRASTDSRSWTFTLREGVTWQDGSPITCEDVRHGVARTFDRATHVGGTNYATYLLDVPTQVTPEGLEKPVYAGPADTRHQPDFDRAVSCKGRTITFRLREPEPDFPHVVALPEFAPRKVTADEAGEKAGDASGDKPGHVVLSSGPYRLEKPWVVGTGGTFVRNEHWDPGTDPIRKAYPDRIEVTTGLGESAVIERLLNQQDDDAYAVSWVAASPTLRNQAGTDLQARLTFPHTGNVDYLALNMRSTVMSNPAVRQAFAMATNRATYVSASGGEGSGDPSWSILAPSIDPSSLEPPSGSSLTGDPEAARKVLTDAGVRLPVTVRVVHAKSALVDKAYAALAAGWERAGFDVQLTGVEPEKYYETIEDKTSVERYDVFRGVWTSDIPSPSGVLPALFDARINIDSSGPGQDVGYFADDSVAALIDKADATGDPSARMRVWKQVDEAIRAKGGYIALSATKALHLHGAGVRHYEDHAVGGIVDLATVAVR